MDLAKRCVDVGFFTNRIDDLRAFYTDRVRLPFEEILPLGDGMRQHRLGLLGSVLKLNESRIEVPPHRSGGYSRLTIADRRTPIPMLLDDPEGNQIELVPTGHRGINQIEIHLAVTDEAAHARFYRELLGGEKIEAGRYKIGETIVSFARDSAASRAEAVKSAAPGEVIAAMRAVGFRYITIQVRDCDAEYRRLVAMGAWEGAAPTTLGTVARISFMRDPDGNFIEISQRASLTGALPGS